MGAACQNGPTCSDTHDALQVIDHVAEGTSIDKLKEKYQIRNDGLSDLIVDFDRKYDKYNYTEEEFGGFRLLRANVLCFMSALVYGDGSFWASKRPGVGNFREGMKAMPMTFKFLCGAHPLDNEYSLSALSSTYDMEWENGSGTLRDGLINYSKDVFSGDTQAMITLRVPKQQIIIAFRGTEGNSMTDMITDLRASLSTRADAPDSGCVHLAINESFKTIEKALVVTVKALLAEGTCTKVLCTGHSLGGALAMLCAVALAEQIPGVDVEVYTYGGAATGDQAFCHYFDAKVKVLWRVVNDMDGVPALGTGWMGYKHAGKLAVLNEQGLFISKAAGDDREGTITECITDHSVLRYLQYLDLFDAISHTTHSLTKIPNIGNPMEVLIEAYHKYHQYVHVQMLTHDVNDAKQLQGAFYLQGHLIPNRNALKGVMTRKIGMIGLDLDLLEPEILRLCNHYKRNQAAWPTFIIAMYNLYFCTNETYKEHCRQHATWYNEFMLHDIDGDGFMDKKEFEFMSRENIFYELDEDAWNHKWSMVDADFDSVDMSHDGYISFKEYAIWRMSHERSKVRASVLASRAPLDRTLCDEDVAISSTPV